MTELSIKYAGLSSVTEMQSGKLPVVESFLSPSLKRFLRHDVCRQVYQRYTRCCDGRLTAFASSLEVLDLGQNKLRGTIPARIMVFSKLKKLDMSDMDLEGRAVRGHDPR